MYFTKIGIMLFRPSYNFSEKKSLNLKYLFFLEIWEEVRECKEFECSAFYFKRKNIFYPIFEKIEIMDLINFLFSVLEVLIGFWRIGEIVEVQYI